jgi:hypothetical protein
MLAPFPNTPDNRLALGRLLQELSWADVALSQLRDGGRGIENVLTAEVFQALDFLPRAYFLAPLLRAGHVAGAARARLADEAEDAAITVLPGNATSARAKATMPDPAGYNRTR